MSSEEIKLTNKELKKGKTLLLFDIDGTLTQPREEISKDMIDFLNNESSDN